MTKRTIWIIIGLMTFALVGLIGFQLYWINSAIGLNNERFEKDVQESLRNVAEKLERNEMLYLATKHDLWEFDSMTTSYWQNSPNDDKKRIEIEEEIIADSAQLRRTFTFKTNQNKIEYLYDHNISDDSALLDKRIVDFKEVDDTKDNEDRVKTSDRVSSQNKIRVVDAGRLENKTARLEVVVKEILELESGNKERIHPKYLDSLLHEEFEGKGIDITYEFGVFNENENNFVFVKANNKEGLKNSDLKANLFPNDLLGNVNYLMVNFPEQNSYLLKQISATLATSVVLIGIIIFCFIYAINTIMRQKKLSEVKTDFINNMTHEFKTPIATVSLASQALSEEEIIKDKDTYHRYLKVIKDETRRLGEQVEKVLRSAAFDKDDFSLSKKNTNIVSLISQTLDNFRIRVEDKGGKLSRSFKSEPLEAKVDSTHFQNAFQNLLENALKYSEQAPIIEVFLENDESYFYLRVRDSGIGISKDQQKKIFDKFYRIPKGNIHDVKGFGLGLTYVKSVVEAHKGQIEVESIPDKGSMFKLKIPLHG